MDNVKLKTEYIDAFNEIDASEEVMQKVINSCKQAESKKQPVIAFTKRKNAFNRIFFNSRRGIAAFMASIFFIIAISVGLPLGLIFSNNIANSIRSLRDTLVDMDGVAGFGIMQLGTGRDSTPIVRGMSFDTVDGVEGSGQGAVVHMSGIFSTNGKWEWTNDDLHEDLDWHPNESQLLVTIDQFGGVEEVVYNERNGRGVIRQHRLGLVVSIYVGAEFTFVTYGCEHLFEFTNGITQGLVLMKNHFGSRTRFYQTIIIHNETGSVFPLIDILPNVTEALGLRRQVREGNITPFDGWLVWTWGSNRLHFKLRMDEYYNIQTDFIRNDPSPYDFHNAYRENKALQNIFRDVYGNHFVLNRSVTKQDGSILYVMPWQRLYRGNDRRMYSKYGGVLKVFNEEFELVKVDIDLEVNLEEFVPQFVGSFWRGNYIVNSTEHGTEHIGSRGGWAYILKNGYMFSMRGKVYTLEEDGRLEFLTQLEGRFVDYYALIEREKLIDAGWCETNIRTLHWGYRGDIIGGEMFLFLCQHRWGSFFWHHPMGEIIHVNFSEFSRDNRVVHFNHVMYAHRMSSNGQWMIASANDNRYYMITADYGRVQVDFVAYTRGIGGSLFSAKPIVEARPIFAR